jgi:hypothetical protein
VAAGMRPGLPYLADGCHKVFAGAGDRRGVPPLVTNTCAVNARSVMNANLKRSRTSRNSAKSGGKRRRSDRTRTRGRCCERGRRDAEGARHRPGSPTDYWQLDATILTESTFSFGWLTLELAVAPVDDVDERLDAEPPSTVPVISTLCPTCGVN